MDYKNLLALISKMVAPHIFFFILYPLSRTSHTWPTRRTAAYPMSLCASSLPYSDFRSTNIKANLFPVAMHQVIGDKILHLKFGKIRRKSTLPYTTGEGPDISVLYLAEAKTFLNPDQMSAFPVTKDGHKSRGKSGRGREAHDCHPSGKVKNAWSYHSVAPTRLTGMILKQVDGQISFRF